MSYRGRNQLPDNWTIPKLKEVAELSGRIGWKGLTAKEYTKSGPLFLSVHSLNYGDYVDFRDAFHISQHRYDESPEIMLLSDDVLICKDGAGIGKVGIIGDLPGPATINSSLLLIRASNFVESKYLYYLLLSPYFQSIVQSRLEGATTPHLYQRDIKEFPVRLPLLPEQKRIVAILDKVFVGITQAVTNAEKNLANARELFESYLNSVFSQKSEGWREKRLGDANLLQMIDGDRGKNYPKKAEFFDDGYCLFLNTKNVRSDGFNFDVTMFINEEKDKVLRKGKLQRRDVVLTTRGTIGNIAIYDDSVEYDHIRINSGMLIFRPDESLIKSEYLFEVMRSSIIKMQIAKYTTGAAQPQLPIKTLVNFTIPVPNSIKEQGQMVSRLRKLSQQTHHLETIYQQKLNALAELNQSILQKAFTGELTSDVVNQQLVN